MYRDTTSRSHLLARLASRAGLVGLLLAAWAVSLALLAAVLGPAMGAVTVLQLAPSNARFAVSLGLLSAGAIGAVLLTCLYLALIYRILRSSTTESAS